VYGDTNTYYHGTSGLRISWKDGKGQLTFTVGDLNVSGYEYLSLRAGERFRRTDNQNLGYQDFGIRLRDTAGNVTAKVSVNGIAQALALPDDIGVFTKSVMRSIRLPLRELATQVDLRHLAAVELHFDVNTLLTDGRPLQGEIIFDDLELLGLDLTLPEQR
jgi:hypothetical protein